MGANWGSTVFEAGIIGGLELCCRRNNREKIQGRFSVMALAVRAANLAENSID
jgi:hypothetical protein